MLYIRLCFIIILGTLSLLTSPVFAAPVGGTISSSYSLDQSTFLNDKPTNNNSIKMLFNHKTNPRTVINAKTSKKTTISKMREICSLFKFTNFERILCFNVSWDELNKLNVSLFSVAFNLHSFG